MYKHLQGQGEGYGGKCLQRENRCQEEGGRIGQRLKVTQKEKVQEEK